ncbi:MAG TPA: hypothetical protein VHC97_10110 [Thermoanaerobaculia bacterium]|jgi:hypothetical protein|nr:hypothetical protein [Thermoanaerobaculia bacterium]
MKKLMRFVVLAGILSVASWAAPGTVPSVDAATCPSAYPSCSLLAGKGCTAGRACCDGVDEGYCFCSSGRYICAV